MVLTQHFTLPESDLAGQCAFQPNYFQIQRRIHHLVDRYLAQTHLHDRLQDLPVQFINPQPRPWKFTDWSAIAPEQVVGMELKTFLAILAGAINTEAPIRKYTQTSRQYLENQHPQLARFVGGTVKNGKLIELGLWEKEECQHTPALLKIYILLSQEKLKTQPHQARKFQPSEDLRADLYRHGIHRVATEYGATCLYLWLMVHTTGELQTVLEELALDEINHMTKFWGYGAWAFPEASIPHICMTLLQTAKGRLNYSRDRSSLVGTLQRMTDELAWQSWSWTNRITFIYTCTIVLQRLWGWSRNLSREYLNELFNNLASPPENALPTTND